MDFQFRKMPYNTATTNATPTVTSARVSGGCITPTTSTTTTTTTTTPIKANKPFCSLAYLAKSTIAINHDVRIVNGHQNTNNNNNTLNQPSKVSPVIGDHISPDPSKVVGAQDFDEVDSTLGSNGHTSPAESSDGIPDIFGEIKNEDDHIDGSGGCDSGLGVDLRRPWELHTNHSGCNGGGVGGGPGSSDTYVRRVPPSLMTNSQKNGLHSSSGPNGFNSLSSLSKLSSLDCWDYTIELECLQGPQDLQLAAELGKTLLERNKELESLLKEHKNTIDEQEQEIVFLKKHTTALREVNDSRLKVYEQLEVGIQDLERANHRLLVENTNDKKHIKTLLHNVETLEARCDELNKQLDETRQSLSMERRKNERLLQERNAAGSEGINVRWRSVDQAPTSSGNDGDGSGEVGYDANTTAPENCSYAFRSPGRDRRANSTGISNASNGSANPSGGDLNSVDLSLAISGEDNDEIIKLVNDLESTKKAFMAEQQRCGELEEQLVAIIQENQSLQGRMTQSGANEEMKSMQEELSILDEVRQGQMCSRCLRAVEDRATINDEQSSIAPTEEDPMIGVEDDERSLLDENASECNSQATASAVNDPTGHYRSSLPIKVSTSRLTGSSAAALELDLNTPASPNPYRDLVEKYEALLEVQRSSIIRKCGGTSTMNDVDGIPNAMVMSLAEEFQSSGEYNNSQQVARSMTSGASTNGDETMAVPSSAAAAGGNKTAGIIYKSNRGRTPTEFSEAETSSSGYSDETSNKATQTDDRPGYFLCSIGDGEDCKFSIYDDASPIDSRFRNRPEYRELFKEIFAVLKKAAENKEEGDKLPLLDDTNPPHVAAGVVSKVPPVTPANEELPGMDFGGAAGGADDTQSIISSAMSEQSFAMSECITKLERKTAKKHIIEKNQENKPPVDEGTGLIGSTVQTAITENGRVLTPLKREPLEYLCVGVGVKKKNRRKNRNFGNERSESPAASALPSPPRFYVSSGKKRKEVRPFVDSPAAAATTPEQLAGSRSSRSSRNPKYEWNGSSMVIYNRGANSPASTLRSRELDMTGYEYRPSTVSQDLHKLKKLDLSYAEVLRRTDPCKTHNHHHSGHQQQQQSSRRRHQQHSHPQQQR